jgi:hypothetical protein
VRRPADDDRAGELVVTATDASAATEATRLWVVSPLLLDTESFVRLRREVVDACAGHALPRPRFVVVDDSAGTDPEVDALVALEDVTVLTSPFSLGHQRAIVFGLRFLAPHVLADDVVVTMDSDGEDQPSDVPRLVEELLRTRTALVLARRTKRSEPLGFRVLYLGFRLLFRVLAGRTIRSGNFAAQRGSSLVTTIGHPSFDLCYSATLLAMRRPSSDVPCARGQRFAGASRMNRHSLIAHGMRMLLPFSEAIAVRMLVVAALSLAVVVAATVALAAGAVDGPLTANTAAPYLAAVVVFLTSFTAFVVLFSGFSQGSALAMKGVAVPDGGAAARGAAVDR